MTMCYGCCGNSVKLWYHQEFEFHIHKREFSTNYRGCLSTTSGYALLDLVKVANWVFLTLYFCHIAPPNCSIKTITIICLFLLHTSNFGKTFFFLYNTTYKTCCRTCVKHMPKLLRCHCYIWYNKREPLFLLATHFLWSIYHNPIQ